MKESLIPPKRRFLQEPYGVTSQKTQFFIISAVKISKLTHSLRVSRSGVGSYYLSETPLSLCLVVSVHTHPNGTGELWIQLECLYDELGSHRVLTNSVAVTPQANYTDWATATGRRILVPTFANRGVSHGQRGGTPAAVNLSFLDWSHYFFSQVAPHFCSGSWLNPVTDPLLFRKSGSAGHRTRDFWISSLEFWPLEHRGD
jgi:hypothetical protein